ncbi:MAG TPA: ion channel [Chitinophagaceae bacterium]|nr:ion channel [Chitinophagaceae bacterium]
MGINLDSLLRSRSIQDTGFDNSTGNSSGRILEKDGQSNVRRRGLPWSERVSFFLSLINMRSSHFIFLVGTFLLVVNLFFASLYYIIGTEQIGVDSQWNELRKFYEAFFFSAQTLTTVGYGKLHPDTLLSNSVATFEAVFGWMSFAVLTGLVYGRFSKPKAYLKFSANALISPYKEGKALMFRMAPYKNNNLTEAEVLVNVSLRIPEHGKMVNKFLSLPVEVPRIAFLALNWTVVHAINEESPFYGMLESEFEEREVEILIFVKAFDEHFANTVKHRTSYVAGEIIHGAKFKQMFRQSDDGQSTLLELDKLSDYDRVSLPS